MVRNRPSFTNLATHVNTFVGLIGIGLAVASWTIELPVLLMAGGGLGLLLGLYQAHRAWSQQGALRISLAVAAVCVSSGLVGMAIEQLRGGAEESTATPKSSPAPTAKSSPAPTAESPPGPESSSSPGMLRSSKGSPITLNAGYSVDLDSKDRDWGVAEGGSEASDLALWGGLNAGLGLQTSSDVVYVSGDPDFEQCRSSSDLHPKVAIERIREGVSFCLRGTTANHSAWVTIVEYSDEPRWMKLEVTVWDKGLAVG